jgi:hypothetical protein
VASQQVEIGKWFGTPKQRRETKAAIESARFPDLYSEQDELVK